MSLSESWDLFEFSGIFEFREIIKRDETLTTKTNLDKGQMSSGVIGFCLELVMNRFLQRKKIQNYLDVWI